MGSLNIQMMRDEYPGKSDAEAAKAFAQKHGYIAIVRYKNSSSASDFTDIGICQMEDHIQGYLRSPYCHDAGVIYDGRATALRITEDIILRGHCELCGKRTTQDSLQLMAGNDFYICPKCGLMFCDGCYVQLPLTSSPGYGMCPRCRVKVQRAIPGFYGEQSGATGWTRRGKTFEESDAEYAAKLGPNVSFTRVFCWADLIKDNETGTFTVCVFEGKPHLVAKVSVPDSDVRVLGDSIKAGRIILRTSFYPYPTYPVIYNRVFIVVGDGPQPGSFKGILVESATNFTEANFQQWAITLRGTCRLCIHVYTETNEELGSGDVEISPEVVNMVIHDIDQANESLKSIPEDKQNFQEASQEFFRDHPEPFLFDTNQGNVGCEKTVEEEQKQDQQPFPTSPEQSKTSHSQDDDTDAARALALLESLKILDLTSHQLPNSGQHSFKRKWWRWLYRRLLMPLCIICLVLLVILLLLSGIALIVINIRLIAGMIAFGLVFSLLVMGVNYLIETQDLREAKRDERNEERAKRAGIKKQIQLNKDVEEIASAIKEQISSQEPLENVLLKIKTKGYEYEAVAKAISSIASLKETEKGRLFDKMDSDSISHILNYFNYSEKITILQQIEPRKREDVLIRFSLSKRSQLNEVYLCDICGNTFRRASLDEHFAETARQAAAIKGVTWIGKLVTFDGDGKAWCPHCFKDANSMRSGRRTVHAGEKKSYLRPPNVGVSYQCKCGRYKMFNCKSVNIFTGLEMMCEDCGAILWVPPTIFDHSKPSQPGEASLRSNYRGQMEFVKYRKSELDQQFKQGAITEQEYREELKRRGL